MDQLVGVTFHALALCATVLFFGSAAKQTLTFLPAMLDVLKTDIALHVIKKGHGINGVGILGAINAAARQQAGQFGDGNAEQLLVKNMVDTLLTIRDYILQANQQPLGDLA